LDEVEIKDHPYNSYDEDIAVGTLEGKCAGYSNYQEAVECSKVCKEILFFESLRFFVVQIIA